MSLRVEFEKSGSWMFRHRSHLPLLALPIIIGSLMSHTYIGQSYALTELWQAGCLLVSLLGLAVRILTVGHTPSKTSGRNTSIQVAETLNTTGMYSLVRHPLYFGNYLMVLGFAMFFHTWWMVLLTTTLYALYYERIMFAEEAFLRERFGETFEQWAAVTPAILPRFGRWRSPALPFSWRTVLRREYTGFFLIIAAFFLLDTAGDSLLVGRAHVDFHWAALLLLGGMIYLTLRTLKKRTKILHVEGR